MGQVTISDFDCVVVLWQGLVIELENNHVDPCVTNFSPCSVLAYLCVTYRFTYNFTKLNHDEKHKYNPFSLANFDVLLWPDQSKKNDRT